MIKENIIYSVVQIDFSWVGNEPRPSIIATYAKREDAITKKDLMRKIATIDQTKYQFQVISIQVKEQSES